MSTISTFLSLALLLCSSHVGAAPSAPNTGPVVPLDYGSFQGNATGELVKFLGMPFAAPPVGDLRFAPPKAPLKFEGVRQATSFGAGCPQQVPSLDISARLLRRLGLDQPTAAPSEDCLFINVVKPANIPEGKKLPVLFWIYGGGFIAGDSAAFPGDPVVARSIALGEPVIFVSANHRLTALGFLAGKEAQAAGLGNAGIKDQRLALEWIKSYIAEFNGDPDRVTIWGQSSGAISVGLHLVVNDGNPNGLFHGAFMESGSPITLKNITYYQPIFDQLVAYAGCSKDPDVIACLRRLKLDDLMTAINKTPNLFQYDVRQVWVPSVDGDIIVRDPLVSVEKGLYAKVPFVTGDCDDEGTNFSFASVNVTNNAQFLEFIKFNHFEGISDARLREVEQAYPDDITQGSPFETDDRNAITPQFKRISAIRGDIIFQAPRRFLLETASKTQTAFAFLYKRAKFIPLLGSFHALDLLSFFGTAIINDFAGTDALVNFANTGNPTTPHNPDSLLSTVNWQQWGSSVDHPILTFLDGFQNISITPDTYRENAMTLLNNISLELLA